MHQRTIGLDGGLLQQQVNLTTFDLLQQVNLATFDLTINSRVPAWGWRDGAASEETPTRSAPERVWLSWWQRLIDDATSKGVRL